MIIMRVNVIQFMSIITKQVVQCLFPVLSNEDEVMVNLWYECVTGFNIRE